MKARCWRAEGRVINSSWRIYDVARSQWLSVAGAGLARALVGQGCSWDLNGKAEDSAQVHKVCTPACYSTYAETPFLGACLIVGGSPTCFVQLGVHVSRRLGALQLGVDITSKEALL